LHRRINNDEFGPINGRCVCNVLTALVCAHSPRKYPLRPPRPLRNLCVFLILIVDVSPSERVAIRTMLQKITQRFRRGRGGRRGKQETTIRTNLGIADQKWISAAGFSTRAAERFQEPALKTTVTAAFLSSALNCRSQRVQETPAETYPLRHRH
jgi:hypothetical protein